MLYMLMGREKMRTGMKIRIAVPVIALLAVWALDSAVAQTKPETGAAVILRLEAKWNAAYDPRAIATLNSLLPYDFIITRQDPRPFPQSRHISPSPAPTHPLQPS